MKHYEKEKLTEIKVLLKTGQVTYDEAKKLAKPLLEVMNQKMEKIAKEYGFSHKPVSFTNFMR